jgi:heme-degrading monooxygenase HmoA
MSERSVSVLRLPVAAGQEDRVVEVFRQLEILRRAAERVGMRSARVLRPAEPGQPFFVLAEWDSPDDYQRWLDDPMREELRVQLLPYLDGDPSGGVYRVADSLE